MERTFVERVGSMVGQEVRLEGWIYRYRALAKTAFVVIKDCTGTVQVVAAPGKVAGLGLKVDDVISLTGRVRAEPRSKAGFEVDLLTIEVLNEAAHDIPFHSSSTDDEVAKIGTDVVLDHRPLSLRTAGIEETFRVQAEILEGFRAYLRQQRFTEIITSKIVASGTEGGTNLFELKYFERTAYLAQSPQFYKEHGVAGFERVFETGHVYRAEPHATSRHLTEYFSLDLEMGFIRGPEDVIRLEQGLLSEIFEGLNSRHGESIARRSGALLPDMTKAPTWEFGECLERLKKAHGRTDLVDDLDGEAERQLCALAEKELGVPAVFVLGFPLAARPFYTHARGTSGGAQSFDCLFRGLEITTGGQRLHRRADLEAALRGRGIDPAAFAGHLRMFELGMPPHGGLAIGLERLTAQVLGIANVREATMYPRDRNRVEP